METRFNNREGQAAYGNRERLAEFFKKGSNTSTDVDRKIQIWNRYKRLVDLSGKEINLSEQKLYNAKMYGSNLRDVNFIGASLGNAILAGSDIAGAHFRSAHLNDTDFRFVRGLEKAKALSYNKHLENAKFSPDKKGFLEEKVSPKYILME